MVGMVLPIVSCNKDAASSSSSQSEATKSVVNAVLTNKTWYLTYTITGTVKKNYQIQNTYSVTYNKDGTTSDSDGLTGTYVIEVVNNQSQIHTHVKTVNGNPLEDIFKILSIGDTQLAYTKLDSTSSVNTQFYFTTK